MTAFIHQLLKTSTAKIVGVMCHPLPRIIHLLLNCVLSCPCDHVIADLSDTINDNLFACT
jgi:hypothetical protein